MAKPREIAQLITATSCLIVVAVAAYSEISEQMEKRDRKKTENYKRQMDMALDLKDRAAFDQIIKNGYTSS